MQHSAKHAYGQAPGWSGGENSSVNIPRWPWRPPVPDLVEWRARSPPHRSGSPQTRRPRASPACKKHEILTLCVMPMALRRDHEKFKPSVCILLSRVPL